mmetsp:Transcript_21546/g.36975  ORF Transcript_21546/g.36975 Transcript_21546/m.36975 type:complete len:223 (-) Transcript_21546:666-1334(-)
MLPRQKRRASRDRTNFWRPKPKCRQKHPRRWVSGLEQKNALGSPTPVKLSYGSPMSTLLNKAGTPLPTPSHHPAAPLNTSQCLIDRSKSRICLSEIAALDLQPFGSMFNLLRYKVNGLRKSINTRRLSRKRAPKRLGLKAKSRRIPSHVLPERKENAVHGLCCPFSAPENTTEYLIDRISGGTEYEMSCFGEDFVGQIQDCYGSMESLLDRNSKQLFDEAVS